MTVIDAHVHLWDPSVRPYPWMADLPRLARRYDSRQLQDAARGAGVEHALLVQAASGEGETLELLDVAAAVPRLVVGVVGWVDLTASDVSDKIAVLGARPGGERLVGLRHQVEDEPTDWLDRPDVRRGLRAVAATGLAFDLLVRPDQLPSAVRLVDDVDEGRYVLDHGAKPPIGGTGWDSWRTEIGALAQRPHVSVKLSGLLTQVPHGQPLALAVPAAGVLLDLFGAERTAFGSDWPVSTLAAPYDQVMAFTHRAIADLDPAEQRAVLGGTATRVYGLALPAGDGGS